MNKTDEKDDVIYEEDGKSATDDVTEDFLLEDEGETQEAYINRLKARVKVLQKENQEYMDGWQRERADFTNYKKRVEKEKVEIIKYANENLLEEITKVMDSFEMAFANKTAWEKVDRNWSVGVESIYTQLLKILEDNNFKIMYPLGEKFDPRFHIAVSHSTTPYENRDGTIAEVKSRGYLLNDRVMRAAQVVVAEFKHEVEVPAK
jgi:molecular chaperone GrpE